MLWISALVLGSAAAAPFLAEVRPIQSPEQWATLGSFLGDREKLESLDSERAVVWLDSDADVKALSGLGFDVQTDGVVDWTRINAEIAHATNYTHVFGQEPAWNVYCNYDCMTARLQEWTAKCPNLYRLESIGTTVRGRSIWVVRASLASATSPEILLAGNIHGDEVVGGQLIQRMLWVFCEEFNTNTRIRNILSNNIIYFMPMFNPDGYMNTRRENANGRDLNRDFPNTWTSNNDQPTGRQVETVALMNFVRSRRFVISLMYHGGAEVVNYPYDGRQPGTSGYSATRKDAQAIAISRGYANAHRTMHQSRTFPGGIVNGAMWYVIYGSHQDHMYDYRNECIDLTLEVSNTKWPAGATLPQFWTDNYGAMLTFLESARLAQDQ